MTTLDHASRGAPAVGNSRAGGSGAAVVGLVAVLVVAAAASVLIGARDVDLAALWDAGDPDHAVYAARIDRTLLGLSVGAALGLAGALMQGLTRNPLADPGIFGINAGASFAMVVGMSLFGLSGLGTYLWLAFAGAGAAAVLVYLVASLGRDGATPVKLAIAGAAATAGLASWTSGLLLVDAQRMTAFRFWQVGTVGGRNLDVLLTGLPFLVVGATMALVGAPMLNTLALGDDVARGLGRRTTRDRILLGTAIVLLAGTATALAGPIAFVGLIVPHAVRAVAGSDHRRVLPLSALGGAALIVVADTLGRVVLPPVEVQVGIMSAAVGAPFFIFLVSRGSNSARWARI